MSLLDDAAKLYYQLHENAHKAAVLDAFAAVVKTHAVKDEDGTKATLAEMIRANPGVPSTVHASSFIEKHPDRVTPWELTPEAKNARRDELRAKGIL